MSLCCTSSIYAMPNIQFTMALGLTTKRLMKGFTVPPKVGLVTGLLRVFLQHYYYVLTKGKASQRRMDPVFTHSKSPHSDPHLCVRQCRPLGSNRPCPDLQTPSPNINSCLNEAIFLRVYQATRIIQQRDGEVTENRTAFECKRPSEEGLERLR